DVAERQELAHEERHPRSVVCEYRPERGPLDEVAIVEAEREAARDLAGREIAIGRELHPAIDAARERGLDGRRLDRAGGPAPAAMRVELNGGAGELRAIERAAELVDARRALVVDRHPAQHEAPGAPRVDVVVVDERRIAAGDRSHREVRESSHELPC